MRFIRVLSIGLGAAWLASNPAGASDPAPPALPRFASLRSEPVNVRAGPGARYPIEWVFERKAMPVEIVAEYDTWRKIRDGQGAEGWVQQNLLSGRRTALIVGKLRPLRDRAELAADPVAEVEAGVIGRLLECASDWCRLEIDGQRGWLRRDEIWGVEAGERFN